MTNLQHKNKFSKQTNTYFSLSLGLLLFCGLNSSAYSNSAPYELKVFAQSAKISGYMQTPKGGTPGSSSYRRPTFSEMDKKSNINGDIELSKHFNGNRYYLGYHCNPITKSTTLKENLVTHNQSIPAGTQVKFTMRFNWARLGIAKSLSNVPSTQLLGEVAYLRNSYAFRSVTNRSKREFGGINFRVGLAHRYALNELSHLNFYINSSIPKLTNAQIKNVGMELSYQGWTHKIHVAPLMGLGYTHIRHKDSQPLPNDVLYKGIQGRLGLLFTL